MSEKSGKTTKGQANHGYIQKSRTYSGKNPQIAKQYAGVLIVHEVNSISGITARKPDGTLTSWIDPADLKIA